MTIPNPMVPSSDWSRAAEQFGAQTGRQVTLCATCVLVDGNTTPPTEIVIADGKSWCLDHLPSEALRF